MMSAMTPQGRAPNDVPAPSGSVPARVPEVAAWGNGVGTMVHAVIARELSLPPESLTGDLRLISDLGLEGASAIDIVVAVEEALDVRFPDDFLDGLLTYGDLSRAVRVAVG